MNWYYVDQGQQAGPVDDAQLATLREAGRIQADTLVWREGMANWAPYSQAVPQAAPGPGQPLAPPIQSRSAAPATGETVCAECGRAFPTSEMIRYGTVHVCAACKPVFMQKIQEGARYGTGQMNYAGFWIRFAAKFIDGIILGVVLGIPMVIVMIRSISAGGGQPPDVALQLFMQLAYYAISAAYSIFFVGKYGATPGKMLLRLKIVDASGATIGYGRATGRFFAEILSGIICYIGYIMVAFDDEKRSLHDRICNTRVIYR